MSRRVGLLQKLFENVFRNCLDYSPIMPFYAVAKGRTNGIFMTWPDCEAQVKGFPGARYKKFDSVVSAQEFINKNNEGGNANASKPKKSSAAKPPVKKPEPSLKRHYSSFSNSTQSESKTTTTTEPQKSKKTNKRHTVDPESNNSDSSDDLNTILCKQMDDIEKRLNSFQKGVDKIIQKSTKKTILIEPPEPKRKRKSSSGFDVDDEGFVQVYTDGACSDNGKRGARAGLGVYWGDSHSLNVSEPVSGRATNNCGEIQAATKAIKIALQNGVDKLTINTDSKFLINSATKWMSGWKRKGWKLKSGEPVKNEIDFKDLDSVQNKLQIKWNYVEAHRGIHGNEMADELARMGAAMYNK